MLPSSSYCEKNLDKLWGKNGFRNFSYVDSSDDKGSNVAGVDLISSTCIEDVDEENVQGVKFTGIFSTAENCE